VPQAGRPIECSDSVTGHVRFATAVGTLVYSGGGDPRLPKERLEAFGAGTAVVLDDFRRLEIVRAGKRETVKGAQDKGHRAEVAAFLQAARGEAEPPDAASYLASTRLTLALAESLRTGVAVSPGKRVASD
jgi:predicted dehydrogenase